LGRSGNEHLCGEERGLAVVIRGRIRLFRVALCAAVLVAVVVVTAADGASTGCSYGVSSVGPVVVVAGHLAADRSDLTPQTEACVHS
jgi:hypothetical protein